MSEIPIRPVPDFFLCKKCTKKNPGEKPEVLFGLVTQERFELPTP